MIYAQPSICPGEWHTQTPMGLWHTNGSPNLGQKLRPYSNKKKKNRKKKRTCRIVDFAVSADHRIKLKESEKKDTYLELAKELKTMEHGDDNTNRDWYFLYSHQRIIKGAGRLGGWRTCGVHPNYSIIENGQNT